MHQASMHRCFAFCLVLIATVINFSGCRHKRKSQPNVDLTAGRVNISVAGDQFAGRMARSAIIQFARINPPTDPVELIGRSFGAVTEAAEVEDKSFDLTAPGALNSPLSIEVDTNATYIVQVGYRDERDVFIASNAYCRNRDVPLILTVDKALIERDPNICLNPDLPPLDNPNLSQPETNTESEARQEESDIADVTLLPKIVTLPATTEDNLDSNSCEQLENRSLAPEASQSEQTPAGGVELLAVLDPENLTKLTPNTRLSPSFQVSVGRGSEREVRIQVRFAPSDPAQVAGEVVDVFVEVDSDSCYQFTID